MPHGPKLRQPLRHHAPIIPANGMGAVGAAATNQRAGVAEGVTPCLVVVEEQEDLLWVPSSRPEGD